MAAAGSAIAGFALILVGLSTLQQGMGGLAESLHPSDLPTITNAAGAITLAGLANVLLLVVVGALMTTVMQSSTASIAVTLSALYAGAVGLDQALALVIGQNIGTATSSAVAAIGASSTAKRLAVAYIAFKLVAARDRDRALSVCDPAHRQGRADDRCDRACSPPIIRPIT